jgi:hypothetical protein
MGIEVQFRAVGGEMDKFYWSKQQDPNEWPDDMKSYWCPKIIQPFVPMDS